MSWRLLSAAVAALVATAFASSGCGEEQFEAGGLVEQLNEAGAQLQLGEPLSSSEGVTVTAVNFAETGSEPASGHEHTEGAVVVLEDADAAAAEFTRCENAVDFVCFRAANAVLRFTGITPDEQARLTEAVSSLETD